MQLADTVKLAQFVSELDEREIPKEAVALAKRAILDYIGVALAGSDDPGVSILSEYVKQMAASAEAGVIGRGFKTSAELAAWVNGTIGHALDYDDTDSIAAGYNMHPSVPILPAVFALGEKGQVSGPEVLTAYLAGFEIEARFGAAIGAKNSESGWHPTSVLGTMAAAAASARILRLKPKETQTVFGMAGSMANGLMQNSGTMTKPLHAGNAARNGVVAALLAQRGFTADQNIVEGKLGFCSLFSGGEREGLQEKDLDLGRVWNVLTIGLSFKPYPSCRDTHGCIDGALHLREKYDLRADQIASVLCHVNSKQAKILKFSNPGNGREAKFSMQYCVSAALLRGRLTLEDFRDEGVSNRELQDFLPRIGLVRLREGMAQQVIVRLKDGREYSCPVKEPKGDPKNPMSDQELFGKFRNCAERRLKPEKIERMMESVMNMDKLENIKELAEGVACLEDLHDR